MPFNQYATGMPTMAANPFMTMQNPAYVNPNHNKNQYQTGFDPNEVKGPSRDSWQKDANEFGFNVNLGGPVAPTKNTDNIKEF